MVSRVSEVASLDRGFAFDADDLYPRAEQTGDRSKKPAGLIQISDNLKRAKEPVEANGWQVDHLRQ